MELVNVEKLIEKYENAETTLQEEQLLKEYFQQADVPYHLLEYKAMFNYFDESSAERFTKTIPLKTNRPVWRWLSVAAVALIMISVYTFNGTEPSVQEKAELAYQEKAEKAYQETQKALNLISQNLNRGNNVAIAGLQEFEKTQSKVFKND
jgi:hypothetical protein